jgi:hypothetical protein
MPKPPSLDPDPQGRPQATADALAQQQETLTQIKALLVQQQAELTELKDLVAQQASQLNEIPEKQSAEIKDGLAQQSTQIKESLAQQSTQIKDVFAAQLTASNELLKRLVDQLESPVDPQAPVLTRIDVVLRNQTVLAQLVANSGYAVVSQLWGWFRRRDEQYVRDHIRSAKGVPQPDGSLKLVYAGDEDPMIGAGVNDAPVRVP